MEYTEHLFLGDGFTREERARLCRRISNVK